MQEISHLPVGTSGVSAPPLSAVLDLDRPIRVRALFLGERFDLKALDSANILGSAPLVLEVHGGGACVLFRYGVTVFFGVDPGLESDFVEKLIPRLSGRFAVPEDEEVEIHIDRAEEERVVHDIIRVRALTVGHVQAVADVLAKNVVLAHYEEALAAEFDRVEPLAESLRRSGRGGQGSRALLRQIGGALLVQTRTVGRVEVAEKPEILWEHPELEAIYLRLQDEFELRERYMALERKLGILSRTAETVLELVQQERSYRVEWYIVVLILFEILLSLYEMSTY
ncbi:MAG: RMD1 family protein [Myxococcota bacterium]